MSKVLEFALANIARVDIETEETTPKLYTLVDMATEAEIEAELSEGEEDILRVRNTIKAVNRTEDIVIGYNINLSSVTMQPEVLAIIDGGEWDETTQKYTAPPVGSPVDRIPITTIIYTEDKDVNGKTKGYLAFKFLNGTGTPVNYTIEEGEFFTEELGIESRPEMGDSPVEWEYMEELPAEGVTTSTVKTMSTKKSKK